MSILYKCPETLVKSKDFRNPPFPGPPPLAAGGLLSVLNPVLGKGPAGFSYHLSGSCYTGPWRLKSHTVLAQQILSLM